MVRSGSGLGNTAFVSKSGKLREAISGQRGTISKIFEEGNFTSWKTTRSDICLS
jgi:kinesin family protein 5